MTFRDNKTFVLSIESARGNILIMMHTDYTSNYRNVDCKWFRICYFDIRNIFDVFIFTSWSIQMRIPTKLLFPFNTIHRNRDFDCLDFDIAEWFKFLKRTVRRRIKIRSVSKKEFDILLSDFSYVDQDIWRLNHMVVIFWSLVFIYHGYEWYCPQIRI